MKGWYGNKERHSLASKGIKSRGILDDINKEIIFNKKEPEEKPKYKEWRYPEEFLPEIQAKVDLYKDELVNQDLFKLDKTSNRTLNEILERGDRDGHIAKIVWIDPDLYQDAIEYGFGEGDIEWRKDEDKLISLLNYYKDGNKTTMPYLKYWYSPSFHDYKVWVADFSQEGHHRSIMAKMIGKERIPVLVAYPKNIKNRDEILKFVHPSIQELI